MRKNIGLKSNIISSKLNIHYKPLKILLLHDNWFPMIFQHLLDQRESASHLTHHQSHIHGLNLIGFQSYWEDPAHLL